MINLTKFYIFALISWLELDGSAALQRNMLNDSINTTQPLSLPTSAPSLEPSVLPSFSPSSSSSSNTPSLIPFTQAPSKLPTTQHPSAIPTSLSNVSASPSSKPTGYISPSTSPSCRPSSLPSSILTSLPTIFPTSTPSCRPNSQPTNSPSSSPSSLPSYASSISPSSSPSAASSTTPTTIPSSTPSLRPTTMPTPHGILGQNWWLFITSEVIIHADPDFKLYTHKVVQAAIQSAFEFLLTDSLDEQELSTITISTSSIQQPNDKVDDYYYSGSGLNASLGQSLSFQINAWCSTINAKDSAHNSLLFTQAHPRALIEPLHERGLKEVVDASIAYITLTITTIPPPEIPILSPVRIIYIILGTIIAFAIAFLMFKSCCYIRYSDFKLCQWCRNCCRNCYVTYSEIMFYLHQNTRSAAGFSLAAQEDSLDRMEEANGTGELSIHYRATQQRQRYLDEESSRSSSFDESSPRNVGVRKEGIEMKETFLKCKIRE